ncbi:RNA polymerase II holoenzyme cyclin-like subunit [Neopestalotiopsis sp. 37M]|nr:RNA polymerase II holoenzyme cyclin-like subunit [Neopestalotiopsis sp. 37M]
MAASFWESTQRRFWIFTRDELAKTRSKLREDEQALVAMFPLPEWRHLSIYFNQQVSRLAKRLVLRQQVIATAQVYLKRFYTKVEVRRTNPYLLCVTALYLACKMEESPQHIRLVVQEARSLWPEFLTLDMSRLGECEFFLISEMNAQMILHQPYRTLTSLQSDFFLSQDEISLAWTIINDHYMTDLPLLYAPHVIALTAILLSLVLRPNPVAGGQTSGIAAAQAVLAQAQAQSQAQMHAQGSRGLGSGLSSGQTTPGGAFDKDNKSNEARVGKLQRFGAYLAESDVVIDDMVDCTQELISFYEVHEQYNEKSVRDQINRFIKARGLDKG